MNHGKDETDSDPKMVAWPKQEEVNHFEKLKVCEVVKEEEFRDDPMATKMGNTRVITNKRTKTKRMIKARFVGTGFADDCKEEELCAGTPGLPASRHWVSRLATYKRGEVCHRVFCGRPRRPIFFDGPTEDPWSQEEDVLGKSVGVLLRDSICASYMARLSSNQMTRMGFVEPLRVPCTFYQDPLTVEMICARG